MNPEPKTLEIGPGKVYAGVDTGHRKAMVLLGVMTSCTITMLVPKPVVNLPESGTYTFPVSSVSMTDEGERMLKEMAELHQMEVAKAKPERKVSYQQQQRELPRFLRQRGRR